jgi:hypothetical protein
MGRFAHSKLLSVTIDIDASGGVPLIIVTWNVGHGLYMGIPRSYCEVINRARPISSAQDLGAAEPMLNEVSSGA